MEFDKTRELPRPGENPKDPTLGGLTLLGFLFAGGLLTVINPIFLEAAMGKVYLVLIALLALAVGMSNRNWVLVAVGVAAGVPLMLGAVPWTLSHAPIFLIGWLVLAVAAAGLATVDPPKLNPCLAVGFLAFAGSALWQTSHFAAPQLVIYNGLDKTVVVKVPEAVEVAPSSFASVALPTADQWTTQVKGGSIVEKTEPPPTSFLDGGLLYRVKGRGQMSVSGSDGLKLDQLDLNPKVAKLGPRGVQLRYPGAKLEKEMPHWVEVNTQR